jgi:hypothetical protein
MESNKVISQVRELINPDRRGGVSRYELQKAYKLLEILEEEVQETSPITFKGKPIKGDIQDGDFRPELARFLVSCTCNRSDIGFNCLCGQCGGMKKEKP